MRKIRRLDLRAPEVIEAERAANRAWSVYILAKTTNPAHLTLYAYALVRAMHTSAIRGRSREA